MAICPMVSDILFPQEARQRTSSEDMLRWLETERCEAQHWSPARKLVGKLVYSTTFNLSMSALIICNLGLVIADVNLNAKLEKSPMWMSQVNLFILFSYFVELCCKMFVMRKKFVRNRAAVLDFAIVSLDIVFSTMLMTTSTDNLIMAQLMVRIARILKVTRVLRMMSLFPELDIMMRGLMFAAKTILWGVVLLVMLLCFWSIVAVLFIHPLVRELDQEGFWAERGCADCATAYASVEKAMLSFSTQLIVGEGWADINTPLIEKRPETAIFFFMVMITVTLAALNLLLGAIVERAGEANKVSAREVASKKEIERVEASRNLYRLCRELDTDESGRLTLDEIKKGYLDNAEFGDSMRAMDLRDSDLDVVFKMLDSDGSGDVEYTEFVEQLHLLKTQEMSTILMFIRYYVMDTHTHIQKALAATAPPHREDDPRVSQVQEMPALPAAKWPELDAELQKLKDIRREMLEIASAQSQRLDRVQARLANEFRQQPRKTTSPELAKDTPSDEGIDQGRPRSTAEEPCRTEDALDVEISEDDLSGENDEKGFKTAREETDRSIIMRI
mmetsp:Transcript_89135/g.256963  ORF Transcript_89135/g.256963 Transcript_89135/m.256963 type:complete len:560 (-) Transcript_89135:89-1768(-)